MEVTNQHHLSVVIKLGCGCEFEQRIATEDVKNWVANRADEMELPPPPIDFPSGAGNLLGMIMSLYNEQLVYMLMSEHHEDRGNESIDIQVRTKVGELPTPEEWRRRMRGDDS